MVNINAINLFGSSLAVIEIVPVANLNLNEINHFDLRGQITIGFAKNTFYSRLWLATEKRYYQMQREAFEP